MLKARVSQRAEFRGPIFICENLSDTFPCDIPFEKRRQYADVFLCVNLLNKSTNKLVDIPCDIPFEKGRQHADIFLCVNLLNKPSNKLVDNAYH